MPMIRPLHDQIVVKRTPEEEVTKGGIFIPDIARTKPCFADVLAVGDGEFKNGKRRPIDVKVGDRVLLAEYSGGMEMSHDGEKLLIIPESAVLGVVA